MLLESAALDGGPDEMQSPATELSTALDSPSPLPVGPYAFLGSLEAIGHFGREPSTAVEADGVPLTGEWAAAAHVRGSRQQPQRTGKQPRKRNYDPNKARSEQLRELQRLRVEAATLEVKLQQLQTGRNGSSRSIQHQSSSHSGEGDGSGLPAVWEDICARQLERRLRAQQENCRLQKKHRAGVKMVRSVEKLLFKRLALQDVASEAAKCVRRVEVPAGFIKHVADRVVDELAAGVEASYHEVERVLGVNCPVPVNVETHEPLLRGLGRSMELFDRRVMPFGVRATGDAWWRRWQHYRGQRSFENGGCVIRERCAMEMVDVRTDTSATLYVQQVLRRHMEDHRVVIVWHAYFEPFTFGDKRVHGVHFLLKGYVLMKPAETDSAADGNGTGGSATQVMTCYHITPHFSDSKMQKNAMTKALVKFVVSATAASISTSNEAMENLLVDEALQTCS